MNFIRRELQLLQMPRNTDLFRGRVITPITRSVERYSPAFVLACICFWIIPIASAVSTSDSNLELIGFAQYGEDALQDNIETVDYKYLNGNSSDCVSIHVDSRFTLWKFGYVINHFKQYPSMITGAMLLYQQQHMAAVSIFLTSSMILIPVMAGPSVCAACLTMAGGTCCAACALANAYCFAWGAWAPACFAAVCGGGCVSSFVVCIPICLAPTP
eukprot:114016_1